MKSLYYFTPLKNVGKIFSAAAALSLLAGLSSCSRKNVYDTPSVYSFKGRGMLPPPGMVYVPSGAIMYKSSTEADGLTKKVSLSPFFIDATEVTNRQYREFVNWVADSIVITDYLKDEKYFKQPDKKKPSEFVAKQIDWEKLDREDAPLWLSSNPDIASKIAGTLVLEENGKKVLNKELIKYAITYLKAGGENSSEFITENIPVIPNTKVWASDFPNSQMGFMASNYYSHKTYDNYPVVGVSWKQARSFADWRGKSAANSIGKNAYLKAYQLTFNLPTEAQWQYAASGVRRPEDSENQNAIASSGKGDKEKLFVNFKQGEGNYTQDGSTFTLPVKSYSPNSFGLFNTSGNVSEWTLDAFSPSAVEFVHDLNPVLLYDANENDAEVMKRKVVRGGSWKDNGEFINKDARSYEVQDIAHSYIGFRCVMPAPELLSDQVRTRKVNIVNKKSSKGGRANQATQNVSTQKED